MLVTLADGDSVVRLAPAIGGALVDWMFRGESVLRPAPDAALAAGQVRSLGAFPLIPYSNRIAYAHFTWAGVSYVLKPNFPGEPHAIHGNAWQNAWTVQHADATSARLIFDHEPTGDRAAQWPFAYAAQQDVAIESDAVAITLSIRNTDRQTAPAGLGLHPFFPRSPGARLTFEAQTMWCKGPDLLPSNREPVPPSLNHAGGRLIGPTLDNCFTGWSRWMRADFPAASLSVTLHADPVMADCVVFVPEGRDFFAFEPVSHMPDAVNRMDTVPDHGLVGLEPGATLSARIVMRVSPLSTELADGL